MITAVRAASIDGDQNAALDWAVRIANHLNEALGTNAVVQVNVTGNLRQIHWASTYDSLADYEALGARMQADEGTQALLAENRESRYVGFTSLVDSLYRSVP